MGGRDLVALGTVQAFLGDNGAVLVDKRRHETDRRGADRLAVDRDGPAGRMGHNILGQDPVEHKTGSAFDRILRIVGSMRERMVRLHQV